MVSGGMTISPFFAQLSRIIIAYIVAAFVFGLFYGIAMAVLDPSPAFSDIAILIGISAVFASIFAIPFALLLIIFSEWRCWRDWRIFTGVGAIAGGIMLSLMYADSLSGELTNWAVFALLVAGCAASGYTYWHIAGRHAGSWRA